MTKAFCDFCGQEITDTNNCFGGFNSDTRLGVEMVGKKTKNILNVEFLLSKNGMANEVDACRYCVIDAIKKLDDRKR